MDFEPPDAPHFFKIIHQQIIQHGRLKIPKEFVTNHAKDLSNSVYLKVPNGDLWIVNLVNINGEVCLEDGWKEFADHYSIDLYHFLVFRYEGNSHFHVLICDKSASEIEYPLPKSLPEERSDVNGESRTKRRGVVDESPESNIRPSKLKKGNMMHDEQNYESRAASNLTRACKMKNVKLEDPHSFDFVDEVGGGAGGSMPANTLKTSNSNVRKQSKGEARDDGEESALRLAKSFVSENPFFMATMNSSLMKCNVIFPKSFRDKHFNNTDTQTVNVTLAVSKKTWTVVYDTTVKKLCKGWCAFARDNHLEDGDVCIFELTKDDKHFLNVTIFRARKNSHC